MRIDHSVQVAGYSLPCKPVRATKANRCQLPPRPHMANKRRSQIPSFRKPRLVSTKLKLRLVSTKLLPCSLQSSRKHDGSQQEGSTKASSSTIMIADQRVTWGSVHQSVNKPFTIASLIIFLEPSDASTSYPFHTCHYLQ